ncbi:TRAF-LIKE FAMILY PROTEIN [Salix viminalis]|uniref:TRAF-LIKE FAMILY PROTEIN n=1 Tax=Salix viminalis TaxID=40686 RepID=A0A9Q0TN95_SALVM|nr:TRAF-LIKE FAMILY PROTEIN [Salix viminalis]
MEGMVGVKIPPGEDQAEITRSMRDLPPAHYTFKIENFSLLSNSKVDNIESGDFEVGSYKWRLCLHPNGNKKSNGDGHISLYLVFSKANASPIGWEVNVDFKLFVYNQTHDKYLTIQDANGRVRRFHGMKTKLGFDQLLPLTLFNDESKGYLIDDCCIFGAEIFVIKHTSKGECLSLMKQPVNGRFTWRIPNFSALQQISCKSGEFFAGGHKWALVVYPKGNSSEKGKSLSIYLFLEDRETFSSGRTMYAEFTLRMRDQLFGQHFEKKANCHFSNSIKNWGHLEFMSLDELNTPAKGFLVNNTVEVEAEIHFMTVVKELSGGCPIIGVKT